MSQDAILPILPRAPAKPDSKAPPIKTTKVVKKSKTAAQNDIQVRPKLSGEQQNNKSKKPDPDEQHNIDLFV
ncbi:MULTISPECIES: hypothetical protein [unclassified Agarivorans]|uniref:hypothetical protein n=1 Tax=unclassified Agarivorans TaxID=2636026 RepID=UPI0026E168D5|nr:MULTISPECIES: hypothetical protein [unclassified Agarivorans]MDO6684904.1 hypothetical protein [Agarivorans sp. 3_MG-2023]MDO6714935.1 hypothetical protein [Agarivorans sp. 2_MG-2023]MDO6764145.1 hypothetical protein [Agarivorans sp. 1_MG-2023]